MRTRWSGPTLVVDTPAKLNLHLSVLGRRPDGYHELETVMVAVGLYDTLLFDEVSRGVELRCDGLRGPMAADESNLVLRAARLLFMTTGCGRGARIHLTKRIPMQAGMGGGSSDAAATLVGLNQFWGLGLSQAELHDHAARLGSDVNFFLDSTPLALCRGRGERVEPRPMCGPFWFVVAKPAAGLSTSAVFGQLDLAHCARSQCSELLDACQSGDVGRTASLLDNDLEMPSRELSTDLSAVLDRLDNSKLLGRRMTGSGSACFGMARNRAQADGAARRLREQGIGDVYVVRTAV